MSNYILGWGAQAGYRWPADPPHLQSNEGASEGAYFPIPSFGLDLAGDVPPDETEVEVVVVFTPSGAGEAITRTLHATYSTGYSLYIYDGSLLIYETPEWPFGDIQSGVYEIRALIGGVLSTNTLYLTLSSDDGAYAALAWYADGAAGGAFWTAYVRTEEVAGSGDA